MIRPSTPNSDCVPGPVNAVSRRGLLLRGAIAVGMLPHVARLAVAAEADGRIRIAHGVTLVDPFGWLDQAALNDPRVVRLMAESDAASDRIMNPLADLTKLLRREAAHAVPPARAPAPVPDGAFGYWTDATLGRRQLWRIDRVSGVRALLLDAAELGRDAKPIGDFVAWGVSPDGTMLAFATVNTPEHHDIRFKRLATGTILDEVVRDAGVQITSERLVWTGDGRGIVYGEVDAAGRPWRARIHWLGKPQGAGAVLYQEDDPAFFVEIRQSSSGRFALINAVSVDTSETRLVDRQAIDSVRLVSPRRPGRLYTVDHGGDVLDILTNDVHPNFRLVSASVEQPGRWRERVAARDRTGLTWHQAFRRHLVVAERHDGSSQIRVFDRTIGTWRRIDFPDRVSVAGFDRWTAGPEANRTPDPTELRLGVGTFEHPNTLFSYRFADAALTPLHAPVPSSGRYVTERLYATAPDGMRIPMSMIRPRRGALRGAMLYGYGAYGIPSDPDFDPQRFSLLDRGVAYVIAHVRGGGDLGGAWHDAGRGAARGRPIEDFIACARALSVQGLVQPGKIVSVGRSAGGWLVGAALNRAPELWAGVVADVPFVDVLTALLDPRSPIAAAELSEVGDVIGDRAAFARLLTLCAYRNIPERRLPPVYLTASLADVRIPWSGVLKYAARLRAAHVDNLVALRFDRDGNHWGPARPETAEIWHAERVAFALRALGIV